MHGPAQTATIWRPMLAGAVGLMLWAPPAAAITCTASAGSMPFGAYNAVAKTQVTSTDTISISCTGPGTLNYTVSLSAGQSGTTAGRYMTSGTNRLNYQLYKDSTRTQVLGDGTGGTYNYTGSYVLTSGSTMLSATIYGAVLANQAAVPGSYGDSVIMIVSY